METKEGEKMKFVCEKCGAKYFHNFFTDPHLKMKHGCRFCGGKMVESEMTDKEFGEFYLKENENNKTT